MYIYARGKAAIFATTNKYECVEQLFYVGSLARMSSIIG